jgi:hypothetical protein
MSWNTHVISDIFITWQFRLVVGWISRQYIHHYFAKIKGGLCNVGFFRKNSEIQDGCRGHMTTPFAKKFKKVFSPQALSVIYAVQVKKV